jgi:hypothetical protein
MSDRPEPTPAQTDPRNVVGGQFVVDPARRLMDAGGGIRAYAAIDQRGGPTPLMALAVDRHAPARPKALHSSLTGIEGLAMPVGHGMGPPIDGRPTWYVVCEAPMGQPLATAPRPWTELMLIDYVLRPIAAVLEQLQTRGLTHRAIRPNNVFQSQPNRPVTLGAAWAAPPAMHQPAVFETAYTALCHPAARGDGQIADDVYALGILLATLALGRVPMDGLDDKTVMRRKLELGDYVAIVGTERLTPMLSDLIRGMLAEDPDHRPPPTLLRDPAGARGRRVAARPAARAQRPYKLGTETVWNNRTLALAMAMEPDEALTAIHNGQMMYWLRRGLGDSALAVKLEELVRQNTQDLGTDRVIAGAGLLMRAIADTDVWMPLCWRGLAVFPDGLGPALAATVVASDPRSGVVASAEDAATSRKLHEIVLTEAQGIWAGMHEDRFPAAPQRLEARQRRAILQIRGPAGGMPRLAYTLNPLIPCASALLEDRWVTNVADLAAALDVIAAASPNADILEPHIAAFMGARSDRALDQQVKALTGEGDSPDRALGALRLLSELQNHYHPMALKGLTAWVTARAPPLVERWRNLERRAAVREQLKTLADQGFLAPIRALLEDQAGHAADTEGLQAALTEMAHLDAELRVIAEGGRQRGALAARLGQEIAAGIGLAAIATTLILTAMG